ncbi:hypothetical protein J6590_036486 [Homalodisca vitripennis]|nr:hypothetical protein J6590_036486 [Homalodisca vitripennis]
MFCCSVRKETGRGWNLSMQQCQDGYRTRTLIAPASISVPVNLELQRWRLQCGTSPLLTSTSPCLQLPASPPINNRGLTAAMFTRPANNAFHISLLAT